jgi:hypothetical protein
MKAEGNAAEITVQKIDLYKSELRMWRKAGVLNLVDMSDDQPSSSAARDTSGSSDALTSGTNATVNSNPQLTQKSQASVSETLTSLVH